MICGHPVFSLCIVSLFLFSSLGAPRYWAPKDRSKLLQITVHTCGRIFADTNILVWWNQPHMPTYPHCRSPFMASRGDRQVAHARHPSVGRSSSVAFAAQAASSIARSETTFLLPGGCLLEGASSIDARSPIPSFLSISEDVGLLNDGHAFTKS
jgi:hypothetical protein